MSNIKNKIIDDLAVYGTECYAQGIGVGEECATETIKRFLYKKAREQGIYASEYIAFLDKTFEEMGNS